VTTDRLALAHVIEEAGIASVSAKGNETRLITEERWIGNEYERK
jgi:hypothetical protein